MKHKAYFYEDFDGIHYPDANMGSAYTYGMDFTNYLNCQDGFLLNVTWDLEKGLVNHGEGFKEGEPFVPTITIGTPCPGSYDVICNMTYQVGYTRQNVAVPLVIKVH